MGGSTLPHPPATVALGETHDVLWPYKLTLAAR